MERCARVESSGDARRQRGETGYAVGPSTAAGARTGPAPLAGAPLKHAAWGIICGIYNQ